MALRRLTWPAVSAESCRNLASSQLESQFSAFSAVLLDDLRMIGGQEAASGS